ncbi:MAG: NlpC/P60 family protein [Bacteroidia bacterium]|nr:NlpC/P60 family protein [Bacteroidia bacterium]
MNTQFYALLFFLISISGVSFGQDYFPSEKIPTVLRNAKSYYGASYCWNGTGPCFDCSGFVQKAFADSKLSIPRNSTKQYNYFKGERLPGKSQISRLQPGDLVYFDPPGPNTHIGIVVSNNRGRVQFIHSTSGNGGVGYNFIESYWYNCFIGARRLFKKMDKPVLPNEKEEPAITKKKENQGGKSGNIVINPPLIPKAKKNPMAHIKGQFPEGTYRRLKYSDLKYYSPCELKIMKNEIFARHGYKFHINPCMINLFNTNEYVWYKKIQEKSHAEWYFSDIEKANVDLLIKNEGNCNCE